MKRILSRAGLPSDARRASGIAAVALALSLSAERPSLAQTDVDPTNDTTAGANVLSLSPGQAISNLATFAGSGDDVDFFAVNLASGHVLLGMTTPLGGVPNHYDSPDTMASVFSAGIPLTFNDDDAADELPGAGQGRGSLFRVLSPNGGLHHIGITGYGGEEFDGATSGGTHVEAGRYALTVGVVDPAVLGGGFMDTDPTNNGPGHPNLMPPTTPPAGLGIPDLIPVSNSSARVAVGQLLPNDVDFYEVHLVAGQVLSAMTAPLGDLASTFDVPDTRIALYNQTYSPPTGTPIRPQILVENEDAGNFNEGTLQPDLASDNPFVSFGVYGSGLRARIATTGTYYLAVSGFGDIRYSGDHGETGRYALLVSVAVPEPGTAILSMIGALGLSSLARRRRERKQG